MRTTTTTPAGSQTTTTTSNTTGTQSLRNESIVAFKVLAGSIIILVTMILLAQSNAFGQIPDRKMSVQEQSTVAPLVTDFYSEVSNGRIMLTWQSLATDIGKIYIIERSLDGHDYTTIKCLKGLSNEYGGTYSVMDMNPASQTAFYRLVVNDRQETEIAGVICPVIPSPEANPAVTVKASIK